VNKRTRTSIAGLALSASAFVAILLHEGYSDKTYIPVPGDVPTIGFGTTDGVKAGDTITPPKAVEKALRDATKFEGAIKKCVKVPLYQYEYDAFVSFAYNIGPKAFCNSTLVAKLNKEDYEGACNEMARWVYVKGRKVQGLVNRREKERRLCLGV
jgi:lysozyme